MSVKSKITDVTCAIILKDNQVLLTKRSGKMSQALMWEFPGGKIQIDESAEDCILREILEETNLTIKIITELEPIQHEYPDQTIRLIPFVASYERGIVDLTEHEEFTWERVEKLRNYHLAPADHPILENFLEWWKLQGNNLSQNCLSR